MKRFWFFFLALWLTAACQEQPPDQLISQFERPQDVALVCWDGAADGPAQLSACRDAATTDYGLLAFVTQTTPGEVAVVDLARRRPIDEDVRIPYASFIPVGGMPTDIAATADGKIVCTANAETGDLSLIDVAKVFETTLYPATSVDLGGAPARLAIVRAADQDFAFVTQPSLHRLAVVRLETPSEGGSPAGELIAWLAFGASSESDSDSDDTITESDTTTGGDTVTGDDTDTLTTTELDTDTQEDTGEDGPLPSLAVPTLDGAPFAATALAVTAQSLFVGARNAAAVVELDLGVLVQRATALTEPGPLPDDAIVRVLSLEGALRSFTTAELSVEPGETPRWLYAIENELGGLLAIDLVEGLLVEANATDRKAADPDSIELPGRAISVTLISPAESGDAYDPLTFDGTFAVASTTMASIYVLDVHDRKADPDFNSAADPQLFHPHTVRSRTNLSGDVGSDDIEATGARFLPGVPLVQVDDQSFEGSKAMEYAYFDVSATDADVGTDSGTDTDTDTETESEDDSVTDVGTDTETQGDTEIWNGEGLPPGFMAGGAELFGLAMREDPRDWVRDNWTLAYKGPIGISGVAVADFESSTAGLGDRSAALVIFDDTKDFCALGLRAGRGVGEEPVGDLFLVTSAPTPPMSDMKKDTAEKKIAADCEETFGEGEMPLVYQVARVLDAHTLIVVNNGLHPGKPQFPMLSRDCYGQAFTYEIRAADHWILTGATTGHLYTPGELDTDSQLCRMPDDSDGRKQRVFADERFFNYYFSFILHEGPALPALYESEADPDTDTDPAPESVSITFTTAGGFAPLSYVLGNRITDIASGPDGTLVIVDQAASALITFDLLSEFRPTSDAIN